METLTIYRAEGKTIGLTFLFKYRLTGDLNGFEIEEGTLNAEQVDWLFNRGHFPAHEETMKTVWMGNERYRQIFSVAVSPADLSFEALWELYDHKMSKQDAVRVFNKLSEADKIKCFIGVPAYLNYLKRNPTQAKLLLATYINKRRFEDELPVTVGRVFNQAIIDLAKSKNKKL